MLRALTELNQFLSIGLMGLRSGETSDQDDADLWQLAKNPYLLPSGNPAIRPDLGSEFGRLDTREQVMACVQIAKREGLDFLVLIKLSRISRFRSSEDIVPGLRHFYRRFAPGRLFDVPVKLGLLDRQVPESELNPLFPKT